MGMYLVDLGGIWGTRARDVVEAHFRDVDEFPELAPSDYALSDYHGSLIVTTSESHWRGLTGFLTWANEIAASTEIRKADIRQIRELDGLHEVRDLMAAESVTRRYVR